MSNRQDALLRIFEATGVAGRLTDDQKRELLTHLEDAVEAKVAAGTAEIEAVGQAFAELGPLRKIVEEFPRETAGVTPDGGLLATWSRGAALKGVALLAILAFFQTFLTPKLLHLFADTGIPLPSLTLFFMSGFRDGLLPAMGLTLIALAVTQEMAHRKGWTRKAVTRLRISTLALYGIAAVFSAGLAVGCGLGITALFGTLLG